MSIWGRVSGAAAGLAEGGHMSGPVRGLMGAFAGHIVHYDSDNNAQHQVAFTIGVIALPKPNEDACPPTHVLAAVVRLVQVGADPALHDYPVEPVADEAAQG